MFKGRYFPLLLLTLLGVIFTFSGVLNAQDTEEEEACPSIVQTALASMGDNCSVLDRNSACYGFNQVDSSFALEEVDEDYFNAPADMAELITLETIRTSPLDIEQERWGVAVMNAQANVPGILPGQAVTFMLVGDVSVENDVDEADVTPIYESFTITVNTRANVRSGDSTNTNVIGIADPGAQLTADAVNEARTWVRVLYGGRMAWVSLEVIDSISNLEDLPTVEAQLLSPMQSFYFETGVGQPTCADAPDVLAIRSPENLVVDLTVNGANISIGSLIILKQIDATHFLIYVEQGHVETEDGQRVEAGQTIIGEMDEDGNWILWLDIRDANEEELGWGNLVRDGYQALGVIEEEASTDTFGLRGSCGSFVPTSPTLGLGYGQNTFFWNPYQGATSYRVWINNLTGGLYSFDTNGAQSNLTVNLINETVGYGYDFVWFVEALVNGRVVCTSQTITLQRGSEPVAGPGFFAFASCSGPATYSTIFSWNNLGGDTVTFTYNINSTPGGVSGPHSGDSSSFTEYTAGDTIDNIVATTGGGIVVPIGGTFTCL